MTPIDRFAQLIRRTLAERTLTQAGIEELKQAALHMIDHDPDPDIRAKLRAALDPPPQNTRSFESDSGLRGRSRPW